MKKISILLINVALVFSFSGCKKRNSFSSNSISITSSSSITSDRSSEKDLSSYSSSDKKSTDTNYSDESSIISENSIEKQSSEELPLDETIRINEYLDSTLNNISLYGKDIAVNNIEEYNDKANNDYLKLIENIRNGSLSADIISEQINDYYSLFMDIYTQYSYSSIIKDMEYSSSTYNQYNEYLNAYYNCYNNYVDILIECVNSSYCYEVMGISSEKQKQEYLDTLSDQTDMKAVEYKQELDNISNEYFVKEDYSYENAGKYLLEYADVANEYASYLGEDNYLEYMYKYVFNREYSVDDITNLREYIKDYIVPVKRDIDLAIKSLNTKMSKDEKLVYNNYSRGFFGNYKTEYLDKYYSYLGGKMNENYINLWKSGNYFLSDSSPNNLTAYQSQFSDGTPYLLFGQGYQNVGTFVHEFGHYNANLFHQSASYDLCETQSQGDELLYAAYISEQDDLLTKNIRDYIENEIIQSLLGTIINCYAISELELYVYTNDDLTCDDIQDYANDLEFELGASPSYWTYTLISNPGYFISYATSAFATLGLQTIYQNEGLLEAYEAYTKIYDYPNSLKGFLDVLDYADLSNPFIEKSYIDFYNAMK